MLSRRIAALLAGAAVGAALRRSVYRVEVAGSSMSPALLAGDKVVVLAFPPALSRWPRPGEVVALHDPRDPSRVLIKRVASVDRRSGTLVVAGDARDTSTDSRQFGPVPRSSVVGRAVYRYAPAGRSGPGPWPEEYHRA